MMSPNIHEQEQIEQNFSKTLKSMYFGTKTNLIFTLRVKISQNFQLIHSQGSPENKNMSFFSIFNKISKTKTNHFENSYLVSQ